MCFATRRDQSGCESNLYLNAHREDRNSELKRSDAQRIEHPFSLRRNDQDLRIIPVFISR